MEKPCNNEICEHQKTYHTNTEKGKGTGRCNVDTCPCLEFIIKGE